MVVLPSAKPVEDAKAAPVQADAPPKMFGNTDKLSRARQVDQLLMGTFEGGKGEAAPEEENKHLCVHAVLHAVLHAGVGWWRGARGSGNR